MRMLSKINAKWLPVALLLCLRFLPASGQPGEDYAVYREAAGLESLIYRGRQAPSYYFVHNGTYFWNSPQFLPGKVVYDGRVYEGLDFNIDAAAQKLECRYSHFAAIGLFDGDFVTRLEMGGRNYISSRGCGYDELPEGYFEVLYEGSAMILKQVVKTLKHDKDGSLKVQTGYDGPFRPNVTDVFVQTIRYYHLSGTGEVTQLKRGRDIKRLYPEKKKALNRHMRLLQRDGLLDIESYLVAAMNIIDAE